MANPPSEVVDVDLTDPNKFYMGIPIDFYNRFKKDFKESQRKSKAAQPTTVESTSSSASFMSTESSATEYENHTRMVNDKPRIESYHGLAPPWIDYRSGAQMLRSTQRKSYSPCVLDRTGWENFYQTLPVDYDIKNDPVFNCHKSTYTRLMNVNAPIPEPTTAEMLRTGYCGPDKSSLSRPTFLRNVDKRPEPAYRLHLSDRTALHFMRSDPLEGVLPYARYGEMLNTHSVTHRDYKWRNCCVPKPPKKDTYERKVHRYAKTDLHGRNHLNQVVKFDDDFTDLYFKQKLMKLKKAYLWPINPITRESLGGHLLYYQDDPCTTNRNEIWPCGEKDNIDCNPICIPEDRCQVLADKMAFIPRTRERHFHQKSYLDMRYPIRSYECWEEVPDYCGKPSDIPSECCFKPTEVDVKKS